MNSPFPPLTRRAFLGTVIAAAAQTSINASTIARRVCVIAVINTPSAVTDLECLLKLPEFKVGKILAGESTIGFVRERAQSIPVITSLSNRGTTEGVVIFGRWRPTDPLPEGLLRRSAALYVDDPNLAIRLALNMPARLLPRCSMAGLDIPTDPSFEFACARVRSGVIGLVSELAITSRNTDRILAFEAATAVNRLRQYGTDPNVQWLGTRKGRPCMHLCGELGQIAIPFYSPAERKEALPIRLGHFAALVHGEKGPTVSLNDMKEVFRSI